MLEVLLIVTLAGLMLSCTRRMGIANPFQFYFVVWFVIFGGYYVSRGRYAQVSSELMVFLIAAHVFAFLLLFLVFYLHKGDAKRCVPIKIGKSQDRWIFLAQIAAIVALPFTYARAMALTEGVDILTIAGHVKLRSVMTNDGPGFGLLSYFFTLSYVVSSLTTFSYRQRHAHLGRLLLSIFVSLAYVYFSTGRTNILLFSCLMLIPMVIGKAIRLKGILASALTFAGVFIFFSMTTGKGFSLDNAGLLEQMESFWDHLQYYTIMPFIAFSQLVESGPDIEWGRNTFRFFIALQSALGLSDVQPTSLIQDYFYVYDPINVYTVYGAYFRDFSYVGMIIPPAFLILHYWLYSKAIRFSGVWTFYYSASVYPLLMQFFQDQYFTLLSTWIQIAFWYFLFCGKTCREAN